MSRRVNVVKVPETSLAVCDEGGCWTLSREASREATRHHTAVTGHQTRYVIEQITTYVRPVERHDESGEALRPEDLFRRAMTDHRVAAGWSQQRLADELTSRGMDIHQTGVGRMENGTQGIGLGMAELIAALLDIERTEWLP